MSVANVLPPSVQVSIQPRSCRGPPSAPSDFLLPDGEEREKAKMKTDKGPDDVIGQNHSSVVQEVTFSESYRSEGQTLSSKIRAA